MSRDLAHYRAVRCAAIKAGATTYRGAPCPHGHVAADGTSERYTSSMNCKACQLEAKRAQRARERALRNT